MNPNDPKFLKLQAAWDAKLVKSGFDDIEQRDGKLKKWSSDKFGRRPEWNASKAEYFRMAGKFLFDYKFKTPLEKLVWTKHAQGATLREIVEQLKGTKLKAGLSYVSETVQRLAKVMLSELHK